MHLQPESGVPPRSRADYLTLSGGAISDASRCVVRRRDLPYPDEGRILLMSEDGDTFVVKAGPVHEVLRTNALKEPIYASPAVARGRILIRSDKHLYSIRKG